MSTYSSDEDLDGLILETADLGPPSCIGVASSPIEADVRLTVGDRSFYMKPVVADRIAAALTRAARNAERFQQKPV